MRRLGDYKLELAWLLLLLVLFAVSPAGSFAQEAWNQDDVPGDCPSTNGWCIPPP